MSNREGVYRAFAVWLEMSLDREVITVLELVAQELKRRGYTVTYEAKPPESPRAER